MSSKAEIAVNFFFKSKENTPARLCKCESSKIIISPEMYFSLIILGLIGLMILFFIVAYTIQPFSYYNVASGGL
ncbi:MAG: hypothetical protein LBU40_02050 [Methanobrevibacter sp.]|jgi:hypothetical protein|nr:hypothetical protein [Methanobrevibacter sp.]